MYIVYEMLYIGLSVPGPFSHLVLFMNACTVLCKYNHGLVSQCSKCQHIITASRSLQLCISASHRLVFKVQPCKIVFADLNSRLTHISYMLVLCWFFSIKNSVQFQPVFC